MQAVESNFQPSWEKKYSNVWVESKLNNNNLKNLNNYFSEKEAADRTKNDF